MVLSAVNMPRLGDKHTNGLQLIEGKLAAGRWWYRVGSPVVVHRWVRGRGRRGGRLRGHCRDGGADRN